MTPAYLNLIIGWSSMLAGACSGMGIGLFLNEEGWLGGYGAFSRRMVRLGHIAFFGLGFVNVLFALSAAAMPLTGFAATAASWGLVLGAATMSPCCFLTAWRRGFRFLFPLPALSVAIALGVALQAWWRAAGA